MALTSAGLSIRATSFSTDFPYLQIRNDSGNNILTNRIHMTDGTRVSIGSAAAGVIIITITLTGNDCASLVAPGGTAHDMQLYTASTGGTATGTFVADVDKTMISAGDKIILTFTHTSS